MNSDSNDIKFSDDKKVSDGRRDFSKWKIQLPGAKSAAYGVWTAVFFIASLILTGFLSLLFSTHTFGGDIFISWLERPLIIVLNILPVVLLGVLLYFIFRRTWLAYFITSAVVSILTLVNYFKLQLRNDPLMFEDLTLAMEAKNMAGKYTIVLEPEMYMLFAVVILNTVALGLLANAKFRSYTVRAVGTGLSAAAFAVFVFSIAINSQLYGSIKNLESINQWSQTDVYISKGFMYPFLNSFGAAFPEKPEGYSKEAAEEILSRYQPEDIPEDKKINVVGVMLEAFNDFSKYDEIDWVADPYKKLHKIEEESVSGYLVTNIFAGGTVNSERGFLTGYSDFGSLRKPTRSYVNYFKEQGYDAEGAHPGYNWFYNRVNVNENLGFENYYFVENYFDKMTHGDVGYDDLFFPELLNFYNKHRENSDKPYFQFNVSYQNHGPYNDTLNSNSRRYVSSGYSDAEEYIADNYFSGLKSTQNYIDDFLDELRYDEDPVIVVMFGDHNPWFGDDNSVYKEMGLNIDTNNTQGFLNYYSTKYFIWANEAAKKTIGSNFKGQGPTVGPYFLMNVIFNECWWKGPAYTQFTNEVMKQLPVIHSHGAFLSNGEIVTEDQLSAEQQNLLKEYRIVEYYMKYDYPSERTGVQQK